MKQSQIITVLVAVIIIGAVAVIGYSLIGPNCEFQSRQTLDLCNQDCGEGILSGICKTGCTAENNSRLATCAG